MDKKIWGLRQVELKKKPAIKDIHLTAQFTSFCKIKMVSRKEVLLHICFCESSYTLMSFKHTLFNIFFKRSHSNVNDFLNNSKQLDL